MGGILVVLEVLLGEAGLQRIEMASDSKTPVNVREGYIDIKVLKLGAACFEDSRKFQSKDHKGGNIIIHEE